MGKTDRLGTGRAPLPKAGWWTESFGCPKRRSGWNAIELMDCEPQLMSGDYAKGVAYEAQLPFADLSGRESLPLPIWCCGARTGSTAIYALGLRSPNGADPPRKPIEVRSAKQILERLRHAPDAFGLIDRTGAGCERLERVYGRAGA